MGFTRIDYATWERREIHEYFTGSTMYLTEQLEITRFLKRINKRDIRLYPALLHCIMQVVNSCEDYRYAYDKYGNIGIWDVIHPLYTVPREGSPQLFSMTVTEYREDFHEFYEAFLVDYARAQACGTLMCGEKRPDTMGITAMPELHFSSFAFGGPEAKPDLTPFVVIGKYSGQDGRVLLPVCGEFVHSVNDGYHVARFFSGLRESLDCFLQ